MFMFHNIVPENRAVYKTMWKKHDRAREATVDNIIRRMRFACWTTKATDTGSEYVSNIYCFSMATVVKRTLLNVTFIRTLRDLYVVIVSSSSQ